MKHTKRQIKYLGGTLAVMATGMIVAAALLGYFVEQTSIIQNPQNSLLTWDDVKAEECQVMESVDGSAGVPGDSYEFIHWLNYTSMASNGLTVDFIISPISPEVQGAQVLPDGVHFTVYYWDGSVWVEIVDEETLTGSYSLTTGENLKVKTEYEFDVLLKSSTNYCKYMLEITKAA